MKRPSTPPRQPRGLRLAPEQIAAIRARLAAGEQPAAIAEALGVGVYSVRRHRRAMLAASAAPPPATPSAPADPVELRRLRDRAAALQRDLTDATRRAARAEDLRAAVFGLTADPLDPVAFRAPECGPRSAETIVLFLSDLHWGERVDLAAMDGLNAYSLDIARARLARYFQAVADLATEHWSGPPPARLILILGGDLVSGEIHAELAKSNEALAIPAVRDLVGHLAAGVALLRRRLSCPIDVISLAGNHGRSTLKPESKAAAETSYDTLVSDFLEMQLRGDERVTFYTPASVDAVFSVYGFRLLATHGDRIGSRGGTGHIGPAATAARGFKRLVADYAARGILLDLILIGHFHTPLQLEEGYVNGSLPGPTEYSRDGRFRPHQAQQLFLSLHPRRGVTQARWIRVGAAEEGSLYAPPPEDRPIRPRFRVPAVGVPA